MSSKTVERRNRHSAITAPSVTHREQSLGRLNRTTSVAILFVTLVGALLRFRHSEKRLLWLDEIHTYQVVNEPGSFAGMMNRWWSTYIVSDPPLYYLFSYLFSGFVSEPSHVLLRFPTLLFGIASIPLIFVLFKRMQGTAAGLLGAALLAINTFAIQYSQEYRPYSQLLFFGLLYFHAQVLVVERFSWKRWAYLLAASAALIYTHYFGGFALAGGYLVWLGCEALRRWGKKPSAPWAAMLALPLVLTILYIPVIVYGVGQARHFSAAVDADGATAKALLAMYLANKAHANFFTNLPYSFIAGYLVPAERWVVIFLSGLAMVGFVRLALRNRILWIGLTAWILLTLVMSYGFYEVMKYPYEARRNIFHLPAFIFLLVQGLLTAPDIGSRLFSFSRRSTGKLVGWGISAAILLTVLVIASGTYREYDAWGYRTASNQADWRGMAQHISRMHSPGQVINVPVVNGKTWSISQFGFYHRRGANPKIPLHSAGNLSDLEKLLQEHPDGLWFVLSSPWDLPKDLFEYLVTNGRWKNFVGGSVVFLRAPGEAGEWGQAEQFLVAHERRRAALAARRGTAYADLVLTGPLQAKLSIGREYPYSLLDFPEGVYSLRANHVSKPTHPPTTWTLFRSVEPGEWQPAVDFDEIEPRSSRVMFPVRRGEPALALQYNGTVRYRFYLPRGGDFLLNLEAKHDRPGPVTARVFASGTELPVFTFSAADNGLAIEKHRVRLNPGLNELTVYYNSFRRIQEPQWHSEDETNRFEFTRWRLEPTETGRSSK